MFQWDSDSASRSGSATGTAIRMGMAMATVIRTAMATDIRGRWFTPGRDIIIIVGITGITGRIGLCGTIKT